jgi:hypothetical protein
MPKPGYLICSTSGAHDQFGGGASAFGILEVLTGNETQRQPDGTLIATPLSMRIMATWLKDEDDDQKQFFETVFFVFLPGKEAEYIRAEFPPFLFESSVRRFVAAKVEFPYNVDMDSGIMRVECRIRRQGENEWINRQQYLIVVNNKTKESVEPTKAEVPADGEPSNGK